MNLKEIKELVDLITEKGISEFELERAGVRLKISRPTDGTRAAQAVAHVSESRLPTGPETPPPPPPVIRTPAPPSVAPQTDEVHTVRSPMVGTFYSAPGQGSPPFVQVGDRVEVGQVLCIIEAMKLMNEIESEIAGEVLRCSVENGQPVEYGEPLLDVRPSAKRA